MNIGTGEKVYVCLTCVERGDGTFRVFPRCVAAEPHRLEPLPGEVGHNWVGCFAGVDMKAHVGMTFDGAQAVNGEAGHGLRH